MTKDELIEKYWGKGSRENFERDLDDLLGVKIRESEKYFEKVSSKLRAGRHGWTDEQIKRYGEYREIEGRMSVADDDFIIWKCRNKINEMAEIDDIKISKFAQK